MTDLIEVSGARLRVFRNSPSMGDARTAALGEFSCETAEAGAAAIREAIHRLKAEGFGAVLGPMDGNTWGRHRLVTESDGRRPFLMEPANPSHYVDAFEQSGLKIVSRYVSAVRAAVPTTVNSSSPSEFRLRNFEPARAEEELTRIHALSLEAFASNHFYQPIALEPFLNSYRPVLPAIDPELVILAEDASGELKGFLFAIRNLAEGPTSRTVILKTYASRAKGCGWLLANAFHERAHAKGFTDVIHALMHESNLSAVHSDKTGSRIFRRYALWGGQL